MLWLELSWKSNLILNSVCDGSSSAVLFFVKLTFTSQFFWAVHHDFHSALENTILFDLGEIKVNVLRKKFKNVKPNYYEL